MLNYYIRLIERLLDLKLERGKLVTYTYLLHLPVLIVTTSDAIAWMGFVSSLNYVIVQVILTVGSVMGMTLLLIKLLSYRQLVTVFVSVTIIEMVMVVLAILLDSPTMGFIVIQIGHTILFTIYNQVNSHFINLIKNTISMRDLEANLGALRTIASLLAAIVAIILLSLFEHHTIVYICILLDLAFHLFRLYLRHNAIENKIWLARFNKAEARAKRIYKIKWDRQILAYQITLFTTASKLQAVYRYTGIC